MEGGFGKVNYTINKNRKVFQMWALSVMFGAMQISRILTRVFRGLADSFLKVTGHNTALGQAVLRTQAAFTFLGVSIMTALTPVLLPLIEMLIGLFDWFSNLDPTIQRIIGTIGLATLAFFTLLMVFASYTLFKSGLLNMFAILGSGFNRLVIASAGASAAQLPLAARLGLVAGSILRIILPLLALYLLLAYGRKALAGFGLVFNEVFYGIAIVVLDVIDFIQGLIIGFINLVIDAINAVADFLGMDPLKHMEPIIDVAKHKEMAAAKWGETRKGIQDWSQGPELIDMIKEKLGFGEQQPTEQNIEINTEVNTGPISSNVDINDMADKVSDKIMKDVKTFARFQKETGVG